MSSLKDKMKDYEVTPPANAWERIAAALDESYQQNEFPVRLTQMEVIPPSSAWSKIAAALDNESGEAQFSQRLHAMEIDPPQHSWDRITATLDAEQQPAAVIVNNPSRFKQLFRYAIAAAVITAVAVGVLQWTRLSGKAVDGLQIAKAGQDSGNSSAQVIDSPSAPVATGNIAAKNNDAVQAEKLIARLDRPYRSSVKRNNPASAENAVYGAGYENRSVPIYTYNDHVPSVADRYIMLMTPDGNLVRMSKKWGNLICCVSGEDPAADCKDQLKKWQEKMATSALTTSAGNVMDILTLVNSLDETSDL